MTLLIILFSFLAIVCMIVLMYDKLEHYKMLGELGKNPPQRPFNLKQPPDDDLLSIKYDNDEDYARYKRRYNYASQKNIRNARSTGELF